MPEGDGRLLASDVGDGVRLLRIDRPDKRNALTTDLLASLATQFDAATADRAVRALVVTGTNTLFAAGADIDEIDATGPDDPVNSPRFLAWQAIRAFPKPAVAAVEGWCLGAGFELAMLCDLIVAGATAQFGQPETNLGIIPGGGGTALLTRLAGRALATRMILTGAPIDAETAHRAGLVTEVAPAGMALTSAIALARTMAARAPLAMAAAKASVREASELSLANHLIAERERFIALLGSADKREGIAAFKERRPPRWTGE